MNDFETWDKTTNDQMTYDTHRFFCRSQIITILRCEYLDFMACDSFDHAFMSYQMKSETSCSSVRKERRSKNNVNQSALYHFKYFVSTYIDLRNQLYTFQKLRANANFRWNFIVSLSYWTEKKYPFGVNGAAINANENWQHSTFFFPVTFQSNSQLKYWIDRTRCSVRFFVIFIV